MLKFKKILSLFLVSIMLFASFFNYISIDTKAEEIVYAYVTGTNVRVRKTPEIVSNNIIEQISTREVTYLDKTITTNSDGEKETWYKITYHNGTKQITGYVYGDYLKITTYNPDAGFEEKLKAFPESYRSALRNLHNEYPKWEFIPDQVNSTFNDAVYQQSINMRKQVSFSSQPVSWRSMGKGSYDWEKDQWITTNGGWTGASREIIAYYMDPRNFLNSTYIYQFLNQSYNKSTQNEEGLKRIIEGTFLERGYPSDKNSPYAEKNDKGEYIDSYIKIIMKAANESKISPYIIASKIIQEQGVSGSSSLISGTYLGSNGIYKGYYNFFNIGAFGDNNTEVITNGLKRAKQEGWNSRAASIIGGAKFLSNNYISSGQDTYYYQDFNVQQPDKLYHQYAQAVHDAYNKGYSLAETYKNNKTYALDFKIPIFLDMPDTASAKPQSTTKKNNYYASSIKISGLTPSFSMYNYSYDLHISGNETVYVKPVSGASISTASSFKLKKGSNTVKIGIKSETGFTTYYTISVVADSACTLSVKTGNAPVVDETKVKKGDTNGDGNITINDLANIRLHLLGLFNLKNEYLTAADTNGDGKITINDLANIRLHLLGLFTIK